jgi:hypothetical protein
MQLTGRYFASIREAIGTGSEDLRDRAPPTWPGLRDELMARSPAHARAGARPGGAYGDEPGDVPGSLRPWSMVPRSRFSRLSPAADGAPQARFAQQVPICATRADDARVHRQPQLVADMPCAPSAALITRDSAPRMPVRSTAPAGSTGPCGRQVTVAQQVQQVHEVAGAHMRTGRDRADCALCHRGENLQILARQHLQRPWASTASVFPGSDRRNP